MEKSRGSNCLKRDVIPAKAGIQAGINVFRFWIPASAGMTKESGQSLLEVLVALGIFITGIATVGFLILDASVASRQGLERTQATLFAQGGLEIARSMRDSGFDNLISMSDSQDQFNREITVTGIDVDTKKIESRVTWQFTQARQNSISFVSYLTDWNQTQGSAANLSVDISGAVLGGGGKRLDGITIENTSLIPGDNIVIDRMAVWWGTPDTMHRIRINATDIFKLTPPTGEPPGTPLNVTDFTLIQGSATYDMQFSFNGSVAGTDFIIKFIMSDGSTKYILVDL